MQIHGSIGKEVYDILAVKFKDMAVEEDMKETYQLGIVGFGGMAGHHYTQISKENTKIRIGGVYDINPERMNVAKEKGLKLYESLEAMLADPQIDIVLCSCYNHHHKDVVIRALDAGKHVLCEKPATLSSEDMLEMMETAKRCGKVFTIDHNRRVNKDFVAMRRAVESGVIGKPYLIESRVEGSRGLPEGWRDTKSMGGGMMYDWGVHLIDQMLYMIDEKVVNVFCKMYQVNYAEVDDAFHLVLTFESGLTCYLEVATNNFITHPRWYVLGKEGSLQIDDWACNGRIVKCLQRENTWGSEIKPIKAGPTKTMAPRDPSTVETIPITAPEDVIDNLDPVYEQMIHAIEGTAELTIKPEEALRVIRVMEAAFLSAESGETVKTVI